MITCNTQQALALAVQARKNTSERIGFVPTMGALHDGHLSLVKQALENNSCVVVSIYVNPTQFNDSKDFEKYPRSLQDDIENLKDLEGVERVILYLPSDKEMYPEPDTRFFDFGMLEQVLEGAHRPGHFNGVAQVVSKLFAMVRPDFAYFGNKDFQQLLVIKKMTEELSLPVCIVPCAIVRESNGLAMSSRNERLTAAERAKASIIYETLLLSKDWICNKSISQVEQMVVDRINAEEGFCVEYFRVVDADTLQKPNEKSTLIGCVAVFVRDIRLIDNLLYNKICNP